MRLTDKVIVVTGASSGLGKAMANAFVTEGARVVYSAPNEERLTAAVEAANDSDVAGEAKAVRADVRSWDDVRHLIRRTREIFDEIDVFVNNAGVTQPKVNPDHTQRSVDELPISTWDTILNTNLRGVFLCTKAVLPRILSRDSGRLIHISSGHGVSGRANRAAYVASKFGLEGFHESLALELADTGVDSVILRPPSGGVYTESSDRYGRSPDSYAHESPDVIAEAAVRLAAGDGENGGRYQATPDGEDFIAYSRG
jgi:3-oxoacyl-[acyl-carrier protein] reductase